MTLEDLRARVSQRTLRDDAQAGVVLGVQSVPDGLATGLLAGLNPITGLNGYIVGTLTGALFTSSAFMVVQSTGAMAMIVADVDVLHTSANPVGLLAMLTLIAGLVMVLAGVLRLGRVLRFVSNAVMVGFMTAVGVNIVIGQLSNLTGFASTGANRLFRAVDTFTSPAQIDWASVGVGAATVAIILLLERTRVGALGLVVAVIATSAVVALWDGLRVATLADLNIGAITLPNLTVPTLTDVGLLVIPAMSIAFIGLVQGAGISAAYSNPDGSRPNASRDFTGQGAANLACAFTGGLPAGGSVSATALIHAAGARSRMASIIAALVMMVVVVAFGGIVDYIALPALAGLLILIGLRTIKPNRIVGAWMSGTIQRIVMIVTFILTIIIPLQFAVVIGVGMSFVLYVIDVSNRIQVRRRTIDDDGHVIEIDPPSTLPGREVVLLQVHGSLFFASAARLEADLPKPDPQTKHAVVILRLRGHRQLGGTVIAALGRYASALSKADSRLMIVTESSDVRNQLDRLGLTSIIGSESIYVGDHRVGRATATAVADARTWVDSRE